MTASDTISGSVTGTAVVTVNPAPATHFAVSAAASVSAGSFFTFTVTALNTFNATVTGYTGAVHFSTSDGNAMAQVPADYTFVSSDNGVHTFTSGAKLITAGLETVSATDKATSSITGSVAVTVTPLGATNLSVSAPALPIAGRGFNVTVTAVDTFGNVATSYSGAIHFTASDAASGVVLPADYTYVPGDSGVHTFAGVILQTTGLQTLTATDKATSSINGSAVVTVPVTLSITTAALSGGRGSVVSVPVVVNSLKDPVHSNQGLSAASIVILYNPSQLSVSSTDVGLGTVPSSVPLLQPGNKSPWDLTVTQTQPGYLDITLASHDGVHFYTGTSGGSIVTVNFHISGSALLGTTQIDLAQTTFGGAPATGLTDQNFTDYKLLPLPLNNTALNPYEYSGSDPTDGTLTVTGVNPPPVANNDSYSVTERTVASDPGLTVASPGVMANDASLLGTPLTATLVAGPAHGLLTFNADGSFVYTPTLTPLPYFGADSFTYMVNDGSNNSNIATVSLNVTARLSIPTNLNVDVGSTVVVPVNIDNPNPSSSGGIDAFTAAIDYDPTVFTVSDLFTDINLGTVTNNTNAVQTISFGGTPSGGSFVLNFSNLNTNIPSTVSGSTAPINYSTTLTTLTGNIQSALDAALGTGNTLVSAVSATNVTVTFEGILSGMGALPQPNMVADGTNLAGLNPSATVTTTTNGFAAWSIVATGNTTTGQLGITLSSSTPDLNTIGGSLVLITFNVNANAAVGPSAINLAATNAPTGSTVTTRLDSLSGPLTLKPLVSNAANDPNVDGIVNVLTVNHFVITAAGPVQTAGSPFGLTVSAEDGAGNIDAGYTGTVDFSTTDVGGGAGVPQNYTFTAADNGVHVFNHAPRWSRPAFKRSPPRIRSAVPSLVLSRSP